MTGGKNIVQTTKIMITLNESVAHIVTGVVIILNLLFYTAYSKEDKNILLQLTPATYLGEVDKILENL